MTKKAPKQPTELEAAIEALYIARRDRQASPEGKFDRAGRWYPSEEEDADDFTSAIRCPSANWPYSYLKAACTRKHIKNLAAVNPEFVLRHAAPFLADAQADDLANAAD